MRKRPRIGLLATSATSATCAFTSLAFVGLSAGAWASVAHADERAFDAVTVSHAITAPDTREILLHASKSSALVKVSDEAQARALGVQMIAPGYGSLPIDDAALGRYRGAFPDLRMEAGLRFRPTLDRSGPTLHADIARMQGHDGKGVVMGVVDSGLDVTHPDFRDASGHTRVAWLVDYSQPVAGLHTDLEAIYGAPQSDGSVLGAVFSGADIDAIMEGKLTLKTGAILPQDANGHGTHVTGIAAAHPNNGEPYIGIAPAATLIIAKATDAAGVYQDSQNIIRGAQFIFERAATLGMPAVINMSLSSNTAPHDGSTLFEESLASMLGTPGRALVVAAGNSGDIAEAYHQQVQVTPGTRVTVPITSGGGTEAVVVALVEAGPTDDVTIGLNSTEGRWITPVNEGQSREAVLGQAKGGVYYTADATLQSNRNTALVAWSGTFPAGTYGITLEGHGTVSIYLDPATSIDTKKEIETFTFLANGVREGTVGTPATHPSIIAVGCTANRGSWTPIAGGVQNGSQVVYDEQGGTVVDAGDLPVVDGQMCAFSGAGPTAAGVAKPDIAAPGFGLIAPLSAQANPLSDAGVSVFTCSPPQDPRCNQIDATHALLYGTSQASPGVAGVVALLMQQEPGLTQSAARDALQAGAHKFRSNVRRFYAQSGPGEADVLGSLAALAMSKTYTLNEPSAAQSWIYVSNDYAQPGGQAITMMLNLRGANLLPADGFDTDVDMSEPAIVPTILLDGEAVDAPPLLRRAPGLYELSYTVPASYVGSVVTFGAMYRPDITKAGTPIAASVSLPVAIDPWHARYPQTIVGGCSTVRGRSMVAAPFLALGTMLLAGFGMRSFRQRRKRHPAPSRGPG